MATDPRRSPGLRAVTVSLTVLALSAGGSAWAQAQPFHDRPIQVAAAYGGERMGVRFEALDALLGATGSAPITITAADAVKDAAATANAALSDDWPLIQATLTKVDPSLASSLLDALKAVSAGPSPDVVGLAVQRANALVQQALQALEWGSDQGPAARATLAALLLTGPGGLDDSYDAAAGDGSSLDTAVAWAALQRVHGLWLTLAPRADAKQASDIGDALGQLTHLLPTATPTRKPDGGTSNDVGDHSTRIVGDLEAVVKASLVPDRDLAALAGTVQRIATQACGTGHLDAAQAFAVTRFYYVGYLEATASMLVPDDDKAVLDALAALQKGSAGADMSCPPLLEGLGNVTTALGG